MGKYKSIMMFIGVMLFILAITLIYLSVRAMGTLPATSSYYDAGIHTFEPYQVLPAQVRNTSAYSRDRRMNPTKTVYMVYYLSLIHI